MNRNELARSVLGLVFSIAFALVPFNAVSAAEAASFSKEDVLWLSRVTYGPTTATLEQYHKLGRKKFLAAQLRPRDLTLPTSVTEQIAALQISQADGATLLTRAVAEQQRINTLPDEQKDPARKTLNEQGNRLAYEAARRELLRAIYSPAQLNEQMVGFWLNHFSIFQGKANIRWLAADYAERAIRPHALGRFRDLVLATLTHPAMLQYLDNAQNAVGHINENYARELMELHTLGVDSGYSQQDIQELARILTGVGVNPSDTTPKLKKEWQPLYRREGAFEFNPARHDLGPKTLLGKAFPGNEGFSEIENAVDLLVAQPACARFVSHKLAQYFVADDPPPALVERMARTFQKTHGDIAAVLEVLLASRELTASLGSQLKDPMHFTISSIRFAYDGKILVNAHPVLNWLNALGQPLYGRQTPDGYPLTGSAWSSSGQISRRFEIARAIGASNSGLFEPEDGSSPGTIGFPQLSTRLYFAALEPHLSAQTRSALDRASSQTEWNLYLLASPDFNYR
jgi:uncharacterized protein (DUF1800 family)